MRCTWRKVAFFTAALGLAGPGYASAQPATSAARSASQQAQAEARARQLTAAGELLGQGKHVAAITAYEKILVDQPDAETQLAAALGLARSLAAQDPAEGIERLQEFLQRYANADAKIVAVASTALSDAREALANSDLAAKQFDQAIEALREIVDDKFSDEARVGKAGEAIAKIHLQLGDPKQAVEAYHQLLQRPASDAAARLAQVRNLLAIDPTALGALEKFIANYAGAKSEVLAEAYFMLGTGYEGVGENKKSLEAFQRAASLQGAAADRVAAARVGTARAYHRLGETKKAIDVYRGLLSDPGLEPAQRFAHVKALRQVDPSADVMPDVAVHINAVHRWRDFSPAALDAAGLPSNDVLLFATKSRQEAIDAHKWELRRRIGRASNAQVEAFAKSIDSPGVKETFVVSPESKALAAAVSDQAPLGPFFKALLSGDHAGAAKLAWKNAHAPGNEPRYEDWLEAVGKAVLCHDQAFGKRAEAFTQWSNSSLRDAAGQLVAANPIADIVGPKPEATPLKVAPSAQTFFNKLTDLRGLQGMIQQSHMGWLPGNEVLLLVGRHSPDALALPGYQWHLRRTEGRAEPEKLKAVEKQLAKGGDARPFMVSEVSKKLAAELANDAPLKDYLKPLLSGDYQAAAQAAWKHLHEATTQEAYDMWAEGVAIAIRCQGVRLET
ncbi:MAG: hypothetical protein K8T91_13500 [Planctomycetes bacterium]|nr:hypothetical protein [Planctomycetota bacterium]